MAAIFQRMCVFLNWLLYSSTAVVERRKFIWSALLFVHTFSCKQSRVFCNFGPNELSASFYFLTTRKSSCVKTQEVFCPPGGGGYPYPVRGWYPCPWAPSLERTWDQTLGYPLPMDRYSLWKHYLSHPLDAGGKIARTAFCIFAVVFSNHLTLTVIVCGRRDPLNLHSYITPRIGNGIENFGNICTRDSIKLWTKSRVFAHQDRQKVS